MIIQAKDVRPGDLIELETDGWITVSKTITQSQKGFERTGIEFSDGSCDILHSIANVKVLRNEGR